MTEPDVLNPDCPDQYLVAHGKAGAVGSFAMREPACLHRGDRVVIDSARGREVGTVLCPANMRQARLLGALHSGNIVRPLKPDDEKLLRQMRADEDRLFDAGRRLARARGLSVVILDSELLLEGGAVVQFVGDDDAALESFVHELSQLFAFQIRLENLALTQEAEGTHEAGCGKPDCGKTAGGGCTSCGTGGGCTSCGSGKTDLRAYFSHLRGQMEAGQRRSLHVT
jgi:cell fate regulator YaaT (PSP1 superfamily)